MLNSTYAMMMICLSNDVSLNPGPTVTQSTNLPTIRGFKISHLNVRSITHKMDSIRLLENKANSPKGNLLFALLFSSNKGLYA